MDDKNVQWNSFLKIHLCTIRIKRETQKIALRNHRFSLFRRQCMKVRIEGFQKYFGDLPLSYAYPVFKLNLRKFWFLIWVLNAYRNKNIWIRNLANSFKKNKYKHLIEQFVRLYTNLNLSNCTRIKSTQSKSIKKNNESVHIICYQEKVRPVQI